MTLDEAIKNCEEVADSTCNKCKVDHKQLAVWLTELKHRKELDRCGVYECFHCGDRSVVWDCDYSSEDVGYDEPGIVQMCHCESCGAWIEYFVPVDIGDDEVNK